MNKFVRGVVPILAACGILASSAMATARLSVLRGPDPEDQTIPLERILAHPLAFKGVTVSFMAQFHRLGNLDNPGFTRFEKNWYLNFSVWSGDAHLWDPEVYRHDFTMLFLSRISEGASVILHAASFSRWVITGKVVRVFRGVPWIEVSGLTKLATQLNVKAVSLMAKGFKQLSKGDLAQALLAFNSADAPSLPPTVRSFLMREIARTLDKAGRTKEAIARLEQALGEDAFEEDPLILQDLVTYRLRMGLDKDGNPLPVTDVAGQNSSGGASPGDARPPSSAAARPKLAPASAKAPVVEVKTPTQPKAASKAIPAPKPPHPAPPPATPKQSARKAPVLKEKSLQIVPPADETGTKAQAGPKTPQKNG